MANIQISDDLPQDLNRLQQQNAELEKQLQVEREEAGVRPKANPADAAPELGCGSNGKNLESFGDLRV